MSRIPAQLTDLHARPQRDRKVGDIRQLERDVPANRVDEPCRPVDEQAEPAEDGLAFEGRPARSSGSVHHLGAWAPARTPPGAARTAPPASATPMFVPRARAPDMLFGPASTGRRRIMPTRALFCCSAPSRSRSLFQSACAADHRSEERRHQNLCDRYAALKYRIESRLLDFVVAGQRRRRFCLAMCNIILQEDLFDRQFVRQWVNWEEYLREEHPPTKPLDVPNFRRRSERDLRPIHPGIRRQRSGHRC